eukprot:COSAG01_NODE_417_length_17291_cov_610.598825_14_plen_255_part_00
MWQVSWAHPKWGTVLASCSYDRKVIVWRAAAPTAWAPVHIHAEHMGSVNSVDWCPHEHGLELACASSDGKVSVLTHRDDDSWATKWIETKQVGVNAVSWEGAQNGGVGPESRRFVTAGCDKTLRIWKLNSATREWEQEGEPLQEGGHTDWVRDVAWAPNFCFPGSTIASCSQDQRVIVWKENESGKWTPTELDKFPAPVWRVSWSLTGNILAVSCGDNQVTLWKEAAVGGGYEKMTDTAAESMAAQPASQPSAQ